MDAQRSRRTRDQARKAWYAYYRQVRFARWFGFVGIDTDLNLVFGTKAIPSQPTIQSNLDNPVTVHDWKNPPVSVHSPAHSLH